MTIARIYNNYPNFLITDFLIYLYTIARAFTGGDIPCKAVHDDFSNRHSAGPISTAWNQSTHLLHSMQEQVDRHLYGTRFFICVYVCVVYMFVCIS